MDVNTCDYTAPGRACIRKAGLLDRLIKLYCIVNAARHRHAANRARLSTC